MRAVPAPRPPSPTQAGQPAPFDRREPVPLAGRVRTSRRGLMARLGLGLAATVTLFGGPAAMAADHSWWQPTRYSALTINGRTPAAPAGGNGVAPVQAPARPKAEQGGATRAAQIRTQLQSVLDSQAAALLRGDQDAFLAPADPTNAALLGDLRRRYGVLRAMQ